MLASVLMVSGSLFAQEESPPPMFRHEIGFGIGVAFPFEKDPLNVPVEEKVSPSLALGLLYRYHISTTFSVGLQMIGYAGRTPTYAVQKEGESTSKNLSFSLTSFNIGLQVRYTLTETPVRPYALAMVNFVSGSLQNDETGTLSNSGFSAGGGVGIAWMVSPQVAISLEGDGLFGNATWKQKPFVNSTGSEYDPSMFGLLLSVSYFWGE